MCDHATSKQAKLCKPPKRMVNASSELTRELAIGNEFGLAQLEVDNTESAH